MQWNDSLTLANQQQLYVNGIAPAHVDPVVDYNSALLTLDTDFYIGNISGIGSSAYADGIYDEVYSYSLSAQDASAGLLARGGLTSSPLEFLASPLANASLSLSALNGTRQGEYLYRPFRLPLPRLERRARHGRRRNGDPAVAVLGRHRLGQPRGGRRLHRPHQRPQAQRQRLLDGRPGGLEPAGARRRARPLLRARLRRLRRLHHEPRREPDHHRHPAVPELRRRHHELELRVAPPVPTKAKLQSFTASPGDALVLVEWRTASESTTWGSTSTARRRETGRGRGSTSS